MIPLSSDERARKGNCMRHFILDFILRQGKNSLCVEGLVFKNDNCYFKKKIVVQILQFSRTKIAIIKNGYWYKFFNSQGGRCDSYE